MTTKVHQTTNRRRAWVRLLTAAAMSTTVVPVLAQQAAPAGASPAAVYTLVDLGDLGGGTADAYDITPDGYAVGSSIVGAPGGPSHGFVTTGDLRTDIEPGQPRTSGLFGAASGWTAGDLDIPIPPAGFPLTQAMRRPLTGGLQPLGTVVPGTRSHGAAISPQGVTVGWAATEAGSNSPHRAMVHRGTTGAVMGYFNPGSISPGIFNSEATDINDHDEVIGWAETSGGQTVGWTSVIEPGQDAVTTPFQEFNTFPVDHSIVRPQAINDNRIVVGYFIPNGAFPTPFRFDLTTGGSQVLGGVGIASQGIPNDINDAGTIVGSAFAGPGDVTAVVWNDAGAAIPLRDLVVNDTGWVLQSANGINDAGQIVGVGLRDGVARAFRLDPGLFQPDLVTTMYVIGPSPAAIGEDVTFRVDVANLGNASSSQTTVRVFLQAINDPLQIPPVAVPTGPPGCVRDNAAFVFTCPVPPLGPGGLIPLHFHAKHGTAGTYHRSATTTADPAEVNLANNTGQYDLVVNPKPLTALVLKILGITIALAVRLPVR